MMHAGFSFFPALGIAIVGAIILSLIIAIPSLRLRGDYFFLATLGFQVIVFVILYNWVGLTRGPYGIPGVPRPRFFGFGIDSLSAFFVFSFLLTALTGLVIYLVLNSPYGRVLKAIREDEIVSASLGKNVPMLKVSAFALGAAFAAIPGALFAIYMCYIDPTSFTLTEAIFILSVIIVGGTGNFIGPIIGATFMVLLPEALRFLQIPDSIAANMRQIIYGVLLVVLMRYRPQGILGEFKFE
jgi:branched-chain amino acid transport system permease protein